MCSSNPIKELFSTGTTKLAPHLTRHRNRTLKACTQIERYFSLEYWVGGEIAVTKLSNAGATAPNNEAQDVHLNTWIYWIEK